MTQKEILAECNKNGIYCSFMTVYRIGIKVGFYAKDNGSRHFVEKEFRKWLKGVNIPEDCIFISDAVKKYGIKYNVFRRHFLDHNVETWIGGWKKGGMRYARKSDIERVVEKHNNYLASKRRNKND